MSNQNWQPCPRCGSNRVVYRGGGDVFVRGLMISMIMGFVGIITIPFFVGIPILIASAFILITAIGMGAKPNMLQGQCKDCKNMWYP